MRAHKWHIDERQYERHEQRRGRRHAFASLEATRTALIVVDMVPFFVQPDGYAAGIVPNINALASCLRVAGGTVAWVVPATDPAPPARTEFLGDEVAQLYSASGGAGSVTERLCADMTPGREDVFVEKSAPSALFSGDGQLTDVLAAREIDTVIVVGTVANVCCESTVRDASTLGYRTIMVADANAAQCDADLNATLHTVYRSFADVRTTADVVGLITDRAHCTDG